MVETGEGRVIAAVRGGEFEEDGVAGTEPMS